MNSGVITGRDGEAHMDSAIDKRRASLIDCFSMARVWAWKFYRAACRFLYVEQQYVCRILCSGRSPSFNDGALRETGKWKEERLHILACATLCPLEI